MAEWTRRRTFAFAPVVERIGALVRAARVRCLDETGLRIGGQTQWLHTAATETLTLYRCDKRGAMPEGFEGGVIVHDGFKSYRKLDGRPHALCNAHHLRELKALIQFDREPWATKMRDCLRDACKAVGEARAKGQTALSPAALEAFHARYWEALREGLAWHRNLPRLEKAGPKSGRTKRRTGDNLLLRLHRFKDDVLRFLIDFEVPFTNNLAEQALRMMKVKMKISGGFRTEDGAHAFAALRTVIATARKQSQNILQTLAADPNILAQKIKPLIPAWAVTKAIPRGVLAFRSRVRCSSLGRERAAGNFFDFGLRPKDTGVQAESREIVPMAASAAERGC